MWIIENEVFEVLAVTYGLILTDLLVSACTMEEGHILPLRFAI